MKEPIDRLLSAAAQTPQKEPEFQPPPGLETRVIAAWRETFTQNESWWQLGAPFAVTASLVMIFSVALNFHALRELPQQASKPTELSVADSAIRLALNP